MKEKNKKAKNRLTHHYKLLIRDTDTKKVTFSFRLNILNVLVAVAIFTLLIILFTALTLKYSPIKSYFMPTPVSEAKYKNELLRLILQKAYA